MQWFFFFHRGSFLYRLVSFCCFFFYCAIGIKIECSENERLPNILSSTRKKRKQAWKRVDGQSGQLCTVLGGVFFLASLMTVSPVKLFLRGSRMVELLTCYLLSFISFDLFLSPLESGSYVSHPPTAQQQLFSAY